MSLATPERIRELQRKLYLKAGAVAKAVGIEFGAAPAG
jgi:hypothetical protein